MSMTANFKCNKCQQEFILVQGMELSDIEPDENGNSNSISVESLSTIARTRTSVSVIDFINSLELHGQKCDGKVEYQSEIVSQTEGKVT